MQILKIVNLEVVKKIKNGERERFEIYYFEEHQSITTVGSVWKSMLVRALWFGEQEKEWAGNL